MKKAILCFPSVKMADTQPPQFPTGLYKIASYCETEFDVVVVDQRLNPCVIDEINSLLDIGNVLCIGLSVMTGEQICHALEISKYFHGRVPIIWGGIHPTLLPYQTLQNKFVDYIIIGEGEYAFLNLLRYLNGDEVEQQLFLSQNNNNLTYNYLPTLETNKYINFNKYPIREPYFIRRDGMNRAFSLETSRGCPFKCFFCHNSCFERPYRYMPSKQVTETILELSNHFQIDGIVFQEDNFFVNKARSLEVIKFLKIFNKLRWKANSRIDFFTKHVKDSEYMKSLIDSGCNVLQFGIESGSEKVLKMINKRIELRDVINTNKLLAKYPISVRYNFIIGFPGETKEDISRTLHLVVKLMEENSNVEHPFINIYTPYPGTPLYRMALEAGFASPKNLEEWSSINWNEASRSWLSQTEQDYIQTVSNEQLQKVRYLK